MAVAEFSYFRAEGRSRRAVETADTAQKELRQMTRDLCTRIGARDVLLGVDKTGSVIIEAFSFPADEDVPDKWSVLNRQMSSDKKKLVAVFAKPAPGSVDEVHLKKITDQMSEPANLSRLEFIFTCGEMPKKSLPAGRYRDAFVRYSTSETQWDMQGYGSIKDNVTKMTNSSAACTMSNPLDFMKMDGNWYIRVPNIDGKPCFAPPDSVLVSYFDMLQIDRRENDICQNINRGGMGFNGPEPR